jgi:hypothetical protein
MKFDIGDFYENLSRNPKFDKNRTKILGTLSEDLSTFIFVERGMKYFAAMQRCKEINCGVSMTALSGFILLTVTCRSTAVQRNNFCDTIATMTKRKRHKVTL